MGNLRVKRRRWLPHPGLKTAHVEGRIVTPDRDEARLRHLPMPDVLPPGRSRYQSHSAGLPSGVEGFHGLGADEPVITIDLTAIEEQDAIGDG